MGKPDYEAEDAGPLGFTRTGVTSRQMRRLGPPLRAPRWRLWALHKEVTAGLQMVRLSTASLSKVNSPKWFGQESSGPLFDVKRQPERCLVSHDDEFSQTRGDARRRGILNGARLSREPQTYQMQLARFFRPCLADLPLGDLGATAQIATGSAKFLQLGPTLLLSVASAHIKHPNRPASAALATSASPGLVGLLSQKSRR